MILKIEGFQVILSEYLKFKKKGCKIRIQNTNWYKNVVSTVKLDNIETIF